MGVCISMKTDAELQTRMLRDASHRRRLAPLNKWVRKIIPGGFKEVKDMDWELKKMLDKLTRTAKAIDKAAGNRNLQTKLEAELATTKYQFQSRRKSIQRKTGKKGDLTKGFSSAKKQLKILEAFWAKEPEFESIPP